MNTSLHTHRPESQRKGATLLLAVFLMVAMLGMVAFAVDVGYIALVRTQLQVAADSSAMAAASALGLPPEEIFATAQQFAGYHLAGGKAVQLQSADVECGTWDVASRQFTPSGSQGNAVRVTARRDASAGGNASLFFGRIFNQLSFRSEASAVAMANPRDIAFVIDLSGSMNFDTDPDKTDGINATFAPLGYPTIGTDLMQQVYDDFGFGSFPGPSQHIGQPLGVARRPDPLQRMMQVPGVLSGSSIPIQYRIRPTDSSSVRKRKAYSWTMDVQIRQLMPAAKPTPNSTVNYNYWAKYLDGNYNEIGYRSYTHFMMYHGRDVKPDGVNHTPLSQFSPECPWHLESTDGGTFNFPPREQPTHAARRATIAAIQVIKDRNQNISDMNQRDWVSIITFDRLSPGPQTLVPLTGDYYAAMQACARLQAVGHNGASTATETGLTAARSHLKPQSQGGRGRMATNKIVVLLTDGMPNLYASSTSQINTYINRNPSPNFYGTSKHAHNAALMQTSMMQTDRWYLYPVGIGLGTDYDFMDRMARMGATANDSGQSPRGSGNPAEYEARLRQIFENIITNPKLRLVQ